ncbi:hypothetical protein J7T55_001865 [Diaporthe amygdali]|uniref:uncharacterized protein n=1 Tax=Phomopsis amygdali TaxID=1214568 RepID=UPI0022FE7C4A|nr:uncharacterized protein J7T55_001865 [Diaporthe amygdali]KAJ0117666.1 hypothetical protein J7T55_001865 [Diaporthe amygdali]
MGLGSSVSSLLETYDNCISLLKAFKRRDKQDGNRKVVKASDQQALLKHSLKTDRKRVERAYSSRVSESGGRFEKGDRKALSALGRVIQKLNAAIASLLRTASKGQGQALDYQSLMSLSNSSRLQAIKTFDQLSRRLDSKSSRSSVASTASSKSSRTSKSSTSKASKSTSSSKSSSASKSTDSRGHKKTKTSKKRDHADRKEPKTRDAERANERPLRLEMRLATPLLDSMDRSLEHSTSSSLRRRPSFANRFSLISMSSDSTRLGEIPERKWHRRYDTSDGSSEEYNTPVMYPVRPYQPQVKERRFLGLFRRAPTVSEY